MAVKLSESQGAPLPQHIPSVLESFHRSVENYPRNIALICTHQSPEHLGFESQPLQDPKYQEKPYLRWDYQTFKRGVDRLVAALKISGVRPGTPIVTFLQNSAEYVLTLYAAYELGCTLVPINPRNLANMAEVSHMLKTVSIATSGQRLVVIAADQELARQFDQISRLQASLKIIADGESGDGWGTFATLMSMSKADQPQSISNGSTSKPDTQIILFTSGTTSMPKGCAWTEEGVATILEMRGSLPGSIGAGNIWCGVVPNNHGLCFVFVLVCICSGAAVAFPGPAFTPAQTMETLQLENCTHAVLVPTMVHALLTVPAPQLEHLDNLVMGGAVVTEEVTRKSFEELGTKLVESAFGMTEGAFVFSGGQTTPASFNGSLSVGGPAKGGKVKICEVGSRKPVPRGTPGDMHYGGDTLARGYIGQDSEDFYNDDEGTRWLITGDQATMDNSGLIYITGRYKEMIIRGGENISPVAIENAISKNPQLAKLNTFIIGAADSIAGEVPVAVTQSKVDSATVQEIRKTVHDHMGTIYLPDEVISLPELGLTDFPRTMAGKVQRAKLTEIVRKYREERDKPITDGANSQLRENIKRIWARAVGLEPEQLELDEPITDYADSITVMRVKDKIKKELGRSLSLAEMMEAGTLEKQIRLLEQLPEEERETAKKTPIPERQGGPTVEDMAHLTEDPELFDATKDAVQDVIKPYELTWDDVTDVIPVYDFASVLAESKIFDSWNFKMALLPNNVDEKQLRAALELTLRTNPLLASFFVWVKDDMDSNVAVHVTIKHTRAFLDQVIEFSGTVKTTKDLQALALKYPVPRHATFPGPMFRGLIYYIEETQSCGLLFNVNHAVIDASYAQQIWFEDFDLALSLHPQHNASPSLQPHIPYKTWADSYHSLRTSPSARAATKWHVKRLKALAEHKKAIYPPTPTRAPWDPALEADAEDGVQYTFEVPDIVSLRKRHRDISVPIPLKAAFALLHISRTGHTHALFSNLEAARATFPFVPASLALEAADVAGPTIESVINLVEIRTEETVARFLQRLQEDQTQLTKHASAPWREIIAGLGGEAGAMMPLITSSSVFNWVPGMGTTNTSPYANFGVLNAVVRPEVGLAVNAGLGGAESSTMFLHVRGDGLDRQGLRGLAVDLEKVLKWLVEPAHWDAPVGGFVDALK